MLPDYVECSNGTFRHEDDIFEDCRGGAHALSGERQNADVEIVREVLTAVCEGADAYCTENEDYATGYAYIVNECSHGWSGRVKEWIVDTYHDRMGHGQFDDSIDKVVELICEGLSGDFDCEVEYDPNEYAAYSGDGLCLDSIDIGEHEEQVDISCFDELQELHNQGRLDDVLDELDHDFCINRNPRREKNEKTGRFEVVGRKSYNPYDSDHTCFEVYTLPGGQWHYVVPAERMRELVANAIVDLCRKANSNG